ncbi:XRE family transcriptional regulator [Streptomyces sp. CNQ-509]|uniref:helix-turn-helix domain-containing protein n=1 Tax=unclassified Streptomyces TaxID=2593676 RepID=UPI00062E05C9|nr:helix-turn-helix transcriptional regulator [Streptomyces sp. CNQ-509]AKH85852.1 XRE family transcriptional regulator [Streptomyces sp. CNQ-509]
MTVPTAAVHDPGIPLAGEHERGGRPVCRSVLGSRLRRLRQDRGIQLQAAAREIGASVAKLCRLELGQGGCKDHDVAALLDFYGVTDEDVLDEFAALTRGANAPSWWQEYSDLIPSQAETHLGLEEAATVIRSYQSQRIPDLLQTAAYARAITQLGFPRDPVQTVERRLHLLERRQQALTRADPPRCWVLLDEAALRRSVGAPGVMEGQLRHLLRLHLEHPTVTLDVVPLAAGGTAAVAQPMTMLRFAEPELPDVVCLDQLTGTVRIDKPGEVDRYRLALDNLAAATSTGTDAAVFLTRLLHGH